MTKDLTTLSGNPLEISKKLDWGLIELQTRGPVFYDTDDLLGLIIGGRGMINVVNRGQLPLPIIFKEKWHTGILPPVSQVEIAGDLDGFNGILFALDLDGNILGRMVLRRHPTKKEAEKPTPLPSPPAKLKGLKRLVHIFRGNGGA